MHRSIVAGWLSVFLLVESAPTLRAEVVESDNPTAARFKLDPATEAVGNAGVMIGIGAIGAAGLPISGAVFFGATAYEVVDTGLDVAITSVEIKTNVIESGLLVIDQEAAALHRMRAEGRDLRTDREARVLIDDLKDRLSTDSTKYGFVRLALQENGLYATVKYGSFHLLAHFLGKALSKGLSVGSASRVYWLRDGHVARGFTRTEWKRLEKAAGASKKLSDLLTDEAFKHLVKEAANLLFSKTLDRLALGVRLEDQERKRLSRGAQYDLAIVARPEELMTFAPVPAAVLLPAQAQVFRLPEAVIVARDPVVRAVAVQRQLQEANYSVESSQLTYRADAVDHPMRAPNIDLDRIGSGFDGASGGTLWGRW